mmetsp:Transcript_4441/g.5146  ORF Transcript_4441/g.5146 Transcript_4441/m.5146 type:complete len:261 (+) Transcript_4441:29-811(+)
MTRHKKRRSVVTTGCSQSNYPKEIYNITTWKYLRRTYRRVMGGKSTIDKKDIESGFQVPYEVRYSPKYGRSVFVLEPIEKGEIIWDDKYNAEFSDEATLRHFLKSIPYNLQCEILLWAYPVEGGNADVELDDGSFINHGTTDEEINFDGNNRASRDIEAGEELLMNYTDFIAYDTVKWFDEIRSAAWNDNNNNNEQAEKKSLRKVKNNNHYRTTRDYNLIGAPSSKNVSKNSIYLMECLAVALIFLSYFLLRRQKKERKL